MTADSRRSKRVSIPVGLIYALWGLLGLLLLSLITVAATLLIRMDFVSSAVPTDAQIRSLWAFLGVAFSAVVTLIGTLLAAQHNIRTADLAKETEERLTLDTVAKLLELITDNGQYAQRARVSGAIATMMELHGGSIPIRILAELWGADKVDTETAVWLLERVLREENAGSTDPREAASMLAANAHRLFPTAGDVDQFTNNWPGLLLYSWPSHLSSEVKEALYIAAVKALLMREVAFWKDQEALPAITLCCALDDAEFAEAAAAVLRILSDLGVLDELVPTTYRPDDESLRTLLES